MCGRVVQASGPDLLGLRIINSFEGRDRRGGNLPPRYNAAPSQELWAIRQHPDTGERTLDLLRWGLIPYWMKAKPKPPPINAKAETVAKLPMFRDAYRKRRCILPIDAFFEWKAVLGSKVKQPFGIAMADRSCRPVGELEGPCDRRVGPHLRRDHDERQRACGRDPRPYARDPQARGLRPMALGGARPARSAAPVPVRADGDLARVNAGEHAEER